jgi:hypothetical protein
MEHRSPHDNIDVRISPKITIMGPVVMIGSVSISGVGLFFFILWTVTHWTQAIVISSILVYGLLALVGITLFALVTWLCIRIVVHPLITARERLSEAKAQEWRNRLVVAENHYAVIVDADNKLAVRPVFPALPPAKTDPRSDKDTVLEFHMAGMGHKRIAANTGWTEYQVAQTCQEFDKKFGKPSAKLREVQAASRETHADEQL